METTDGWPIQARFWLEWGCSHVTDLDPTNKLDCPYAMGTNTFSRERPKSFRHILLLPSPPVAYGRGKPTNLGISFRASAPQLQTLRLRIRSHAGACPPPAQRTATGYAGRCVEVAEARSMSALDWRCRAFLAKAVLRFQHSKLPAVCGEAALHSSQSSEGWVVRASGGLAVEQFSPLRNRL